MAQLGSQQLGTAQLGAGLVSVEGTANLSYSASTDLPNYAVGTATSSHTTSTDVTAISDVTGTASIQYTSEAVIEAVSNVSGSANASYDSSTTVEAVANTSGTANYTYTSTSTVTFPLQSLDVLFYINRLDKDTATAVNADTSDYPNITIGETTRFSFYIKDPTGYPVDGEVKSAEDRYNQLKEFSKPAGKATTGETLSSVYFKERDYANTDIDSLLVSIEPGDGIDQAKGVWGIITSVDDTTEIFGSIARIDLEVFVLAEYDDYTDRSAVKADLEV